MKDNNAIELERMSRTPIHAPRTSRRDSLFGLSRSVWSLLTVTLLSGALAACASDDNTTDVKDDTNDKDEPTEIELMSLSSEGGVSPQVDAVVRIFEKKHPEYRVKLTSFPSGEEMRPALKKRMEEGNPPDVFWEGGPTMEQWLDVGKGLTALDDYYDDMGWNDVLLAGAIKDSTLRGKIYSVPVAFQRHNNTFYRMAAFKDNGIAPPTSMTEFFAACDKLKAAGVTPVSTVAQNWILRMLYNDIAIGSGGGRFYADHFGGQGQLDEAKLNATVDDFVRILKDYSTFGDTAKSYQGGADLFIEEKAAMFMHGPWAMGYFASNALTPGTDYGMFGSPGAANTMLYQTSNYAMPKEAANPDGAAALLDAFASEEGQVQFNLLNNSCPARLGVSLEDFDDVSQSICSTEGIEITVTAYEPWDPVFKTFSEAIQIGTDGKVTIPDEAVAALKEGLKKPLEL